MMLLLDFAVAIVNCTGGKKTHGNHFNNNTDREYLSVSNNKKDSTETTKTIKDSEEFGIF